MTSATKPETRGRRPTRRMRFRSSAALVAAIAVAVAAVWAADPKPTHARDVKAELKEILDDNVPAGPWVYDDMDAAFLKARAQKKPLFVVFR